MDSSIIEKLGELRQQEILEGVARGRRGEALPAWWRQRLGLALIAVGRRLASTTLDADYNVIPPVHSLHSDV